METQAASLSAAMNNSRAAAEERVTQLMAVAETANAAVDAANLRLEQMQDTAPLAADGSTAQEAVRKRDVLRVKLSDKAAAVEQLERRLTLLAAQLAKQQAQAAAAAAAKQHAALLQEVPAGHRRSVIERLSWLGSASLM